ncbi:MAG: alcohol dehydrogenase catalytic domain-containing protein [Actinomycetota bacterium]|nr:alcohol dehydrogenase catalytic domain-containing protein [Actinomycetota bacterium]
MRAVLYRRFRETPRVENVPEPVVAGDAALVRVRATGVCRSDWHGWQGHDDDITLPHVPGHEFAGEVVAVGTDVRRWETGRRVTAPFVCACGDCPECLAGDHQVCRRQEQPGFTYWGSFADLVVVPRADVNLVRLPDDLAYDAAAGLGCRFTTSFRAVVHVGAVRAGEWLAVHGCGGVGLAAVAIGAAAGARVIAVDVGAGALELASALGAEVTIDASVADSAAAVTDVTDGGAHVSLDALGSPDTCVGSIRSLRRRGRHVQVGLLPPAAGRTDVPMDLVVARELAVLGSHGMAAHHYREVLALVSRGVLDPGRLVRRHVSLEEAGDALATMASSPGAGITVVRP